MTAPLPARADKIRQQQWMLDYLQIARAHQISTGAGVTVGLPDTGVEAHPDLGANLLPGINLVQPGGSGRIDLTGHGTGMAGVIAGRGHSGQAGILGIAPSAKILPIVSAGKYGGLQTIADGIELAVKRGARVVNVSSGGPKSLSLRRAVQAAEQADALIVASNGNTTKTVMDEYPASMPGVLAVGAIGPDGQYAPVSYPGGNIGICAPGVKVITTGQAGRYRIVTGTSVATAIVSGAAALVRSRYPNLSAPEVMHRLTATADDIGPPGRDDQCGYGVLNIVKALTADVPPMTATGTPASPAPSAPAASSPPSTPTSASAPSSAASQPASSPLPLYAGIGAVAVATAGSILALIVIRRRRRDATDHHSPTG
ncbi:S8 family serine peptidase [Actinoplanes utahensis]|uniref:S8 family serine peptidase n=1 Tax=Actinoplanes utahensis TaxID=1869 RepID=UPI00137822C7|nr:S8 family serine peptidase [Actinoplanes utahensis]